MNRGAHFLPDVVAATVLAGDGVGFEVDRGLREAAEVDVDGLGAFVIKFGVAVVVLLLLGSQGGGGRDCKGSSGREAGKIHCRFRSG